ncbi:aminoglycoside N3'-acetyltransferase [Sphingomonas naasensis]|uniref:Aminoglycoside N(3)-acetyltransferase n=1 Tax=Sphingomonas naasensis TaxID=1344951 RepID=A0A4V3QXD1_9SPHN|nr:AAC(3) family N-acetyltransferase [Sphingomonas naasensis]NIJ18726.1 aminoglycoside N3'-acetyltransferase [Sphingomonas naasensis]TGX45962.1 AAC(3) family N-acetyltransferase [Sphingomonas naasensis]
MQSTTCDELVAQLRALGVREGGVLLVHSSYRAVRPVAGGPIGLIAALREALGPEGTLAMPSATGEDDQPFDPAATPNREDLGIVPALFWQQPGVVRSAHFDAVAAIGPKAEWITGGPFVLPPTAPGSAIDRIREAGGQILLLGVGHDANTMLHLAELIGGAPYRSDFHYTAADGTRVHYGENDSCCENFALADDWLRAEGRQREGRVGHAEARLIEAADLIRVAVARIAADPLVFLHGSAEGCEECDEARASIR